MKSNKKFFGLPKFSHVLINHIAIISEKRFETLGDVIAMAGGVSAKGFLRSASIERRRAGAAVMDRLQVDLRDDNDLQISLLDGDFVSVSPIKGEIANQILVRGAVARPGGYQWKKGLRITDVIGDVDQDLLNDSDLEAALLVRRIGDDLKVEVLKVDLGAAIAAPGSASDLILKARDELLVFSVAYGDPDFRDGADLEEQTSDGESLIEANMTLGEYSDEEEKEGECREEGDDKGYLLLFSFFFPYCPSHNR